MLTREETERLAASIHALRAEWPIGSLCTFIWARNTRPYRDLALELTYVALDPKTETPARVDQDGPWKRLHTTTVTNQSAVLEHVDFTEACTVCLKDREHLWHGATGTVNDHDWTPPQPAVPAPLSLRERVQRMTDEREPV